MEYVHIVQWFQSFYDLDKNAPNVIFFEVSLLFLMLGNFLEEISIVGILHHNTKPTDALQTRFMIIWTYQSEEEASSMKAS